MLGQVLCYIGLHHWMYLNKNKDCRVCGRKNCNKSQVQEQTFYCDGYGLIWKDTDK